MIRLTDEEIQEVFDAFLKEHPEAQWDSIMMCQAQNKAQLKKVVELLQSMYCYKGKAADGKEYRTILLNESDWQALLDETQ